MNYLYLDNYRNFHKIHIPIMDFNFLVGENSTGKSSILSLIELFSNYTFWNSHNFYNDKVDIRLFSDITYGNTDPKEIFKIGFYNDDDKKNETINKISLNFDILILKYKNNQGIPELFEFNFAINEFIFNVFLDTKKIEYTYEIIKNKKAALNKCISNTKNFENQKKLYINKESITQYSKSVNFIAAELLSNIYLEHNNKKKYYSIIPFFIKNLTWINPLRSKPQRTYDKYYEKFSPEGEHTPYDLNTKLNEKDFNESLRLFGIKSGLYNLILKNNYGEDKFSPFEILFNIKGKKYNIVNVGYGISQILPILSEIFKYKGTHWFSIQQPEVHIHPRAQAALGDLFFNEFVDGKKKFFIETHSDFIIDRFRYNFKPHKVKKNNSDLENRAQVLFFVKNKNGNKVYSIKINNDGEYNNKLPYSFRNFFIKESLKLLSL